MTQPEPDPPQHGPTGSLLVSLRWPLALIACTALILLAVLLVLRGAERAAVDAGRAAREVGRQARDVAAAFRTGTITETFLAAIPELTSTRTGNLELAASEVTEIFSRSEEKRIFWDWIPLGETVTEIRVPVTYRYHVRLDDPWRIEVDEHTCVVHAPPVRPSLPPAIHTDRMEKRIGGSWLRFDGERQLEELERGITPALVEYASDRRHLRIVREEARRTVAEFVRAWLLREGQWSDVGFRAVVVRFADDPAATERAPGPTLQLEP